MDDIKKAVIAFLGVIILIISISVLENLTGKVVLIKDNQLFEENEMTKLSVYPKVVRVEKISGFIIKDNIKVEVIPGSGGTFNKVEFFKKGSSEVFEEFNLKCNGFKCTNEVSGYQILDNKWKTGDYIVRVKDGSTRDYVTVEFRVESIF